MIVIDSSIVIDLLRGRDTPAALTLRDEIPPRDVLIGDVVLMEVLQGARSEKDAAAIELRLRRFTMATMLDFDLASAAAANFRKLRALGWTVRTMPDLIIGTFCIERGHSLLQQDRDFAPMVEHLGLRLA